MNKLTVDRRSFQAFPFHLVEPSPWPILTSFALLTLTVSAVLYMHGFANGGTLLSLGFILTASGMTLWFRDIIAEGTKSIIISQIILLSAKVISPEEVNKAYLLYCNENSKTQRNHSILN